MDVRVIGLLCCFDYIVLLCRLFGPLVAIILFGIGTESTIDGFALGVYMLIIGVVVLLLEISFAMQLLTKFMLSGDSIFFQFWDVLCLFDGWKRSALYACVGLFCFVKPVSVRLGIIAGIVVEVLALLYLLKEFRNWLLYREQLQAQGNVYHRFDNQRDVVADREHSAAFAFDQQGSSSMASAAAPPQSQTPTASTLLVNS